MIMFSTGSFACYEWHGCKNHGVPCIVHLEPRPGDNWDKKDEHAMWVLLARFAWQTENSNASGWACRCRTVAAGWCLLSPLPPVYRQHGAVWCKLLNIRRRACRCRKGRQSSNCWAASAGSVCNNLLMHGLVGQAIILRVADGAQVPHGAAGYYLLGRICRLSNRQKQAVQYFAAALALDPLLWCAYEELCILGSPKLALGERSSQQLARVAFRPGVFRFYSVA